MIVISQTINGLTDFNFVVIIEGEEMCQNIT